MFSVDQISIPENIKDKPLACQQIKHNTSTPYTKNSDNADSFSKRNIFNRSIREPWIYNSTV